MRAQYNMLGNYLHQKFKLVGLNLTRLYQPHILATITRCGTLPLNQPHIPTILNDTSYTCHQFVRLSRWPHTMGASVERVHNFLKSWWFPFPNPNSWAGKVFENKAPRLIRLWQLGNGQTITLSANVWLQDSALKDILMK